MTAYPTRAPRWKRVLDSDRSYRLLTFAVFAAVWEVYGTFWGGLLIPTFTETAAAFADLLRTAAFWDALWVSNQALLLGFACAVAVGVPLGVLLGRFRLLERLTDVYLNILLVTPMAAIIPLLIMSVGFGLLSRVILVALFAVVMVVVNVRTGVRQVDPGLIQMARSFGASERQLWRDVLIPGALPAIMTGIRLGLGRAVTGMVIVELLMVSLALGGLILQFRGTFNAAGLYAVIAAVLIESLLLIALAQRLERLIAPWASTHQQGKARR
ncbi:ABC transporter permease [Glycomyces terrestris]|uniref:ABC transporter permease n=1 Tax=Glycomyces terrestris TaxID=2493553 RepID=A0A426V2X1_9ACTN|nr:ABC transporter permease [Glycomyces terrestris]RRS01253.1 ABC transporter permease [Glycomyces terrestris]